MFKYVIKRILLMIPVLIGVSFFVFTLLYFSPGDPAIMVLGADADPAALQAWRDERGLNDPLLVQYADYMMGIITEFDFGNSYTTNKPVKDQLMAAFPVTFALAFPVMIISILVGLVLGIISAKHRNSWIDALARVFGMAGISIPTFWTAPMLILLFSVTLELTPVSGWYSWKHAILPILTMSLYAIAGQMRMSRSCILECMRQDYVVTARAKGLDERTITRKHVLSNAMIPIITNAGSHFGSSMGGSLVMDQIFTLPGLGILLVTAVQTRDYPQIRGSVMLLALTYSVVNLLVDLSYAYLDPRIKDQYTGGKKRKKKNDKEEKVG